MTKVSWRKAIAAMAAVAAALLALVVVVRSDGLPAVDAASSRATHWFVHRDTGTAVLVDGYGGRALARVEAASPGEQTSIVEGDAGAYILNDALGESRALDTAQVRVGSPVGVTALGGGSTVAASTQPGLVVVDTGAGEASLLPASGESIGFEVEVGADTEIAPDGSVWSIVGDQLVRSSTAVVAPGRSLGADDVALSLVGSRPLVLDRSNRRVLVGNGSWQDLPTDAPPSELVLQEPGPPADCGWVGSGDQLWCVGESGLDELSEVPALALSGGDQLAIAGDAGAVVRRAPAGIVQFDWRSAEVLDELTPFVEADSSLEVAATVDLIWIDDSAGDFVWSVHPWGMEAIDKNDEGTLELGDTGEFIEADVELETAGRRSSSQASGEEEIRDPDDNGIDDPPIAVDDPVTARAGALVRIPVLANDWDPDGEAIVVTDVGSAARGTVDISTASEVTYQPDPGYVGLDKFEYTIADGDGTTASATVYLELLPVDAANQPPTGSPDEVQTGPGVDVVIDVLLNDIDPERDSLRIGSFAPPPEDSGLGTVSEVETPSGLPALRYQPEPGFEGTARFTYRPVDVLGALGDEVEVRVEVARLGDENRPPITRPDSARVRRGAEQHINVVGNDIDPDGDPLVLSVVEPLPEGLEASPRGEQLDVVVRPGSDSLLPFQYEIDDGNGHQVRGAVLIEVIDDDAPNMPPIVNPDSHTAVVGQSVLLDVTANDQDPDGDPLAIIDVTQPSDGDGEVTIIGRDRVEFQAADVEPDTEGEAVRFTYTVTDGNEHEVVGDVTMSILPEPLPEPPWAQDDSSFTLVDTPVAIDVLRNDRDPSGGSLALVGTPGCPAGGTAVRTSDGLVRFTPPAGASGVFRCTYEVRNSQELSDTASIVISVQEPSASNAPPRANSDFETVVVGRTIDIAVTGNDVDPDGDPADLELLSSTAPSLGTAERIGNMIRFRAPQVTGTTNLKYQIADPEGAIAVGNVQITITEPENVAPTARNDFRANPSPAGPERYDLATLVFDPDHDLGELSVAVDSASGNGYTVGVGATAITITPTADKVGVITVGYTVTDPENASDRGVLTYEVLEPLNRAPVAVDDAAQVETGSSVTVPVLTNDSDQDGDALTMTITSLPDGALGSASKSGNGIVFASNPGASGTAVIGYSISDGEFTADATLRVTVLPCAESFPAAGDDFLTTGYQQPIEINFGNYATNGEVNITNSPTGYAGGVYTPPPGFNGVATISYEVTNSCRQRATGTISIDVNQSPSPQHQSLKMSRGAIQEIPWSSLAGDDEPLTIASMSGAPGWATHNGSILRLAPPIGAAHGDYAWTVTVVDPGGLPAVVNVNVTLTNARPAAVPDTIDLVDGALQFDIVNNDTDPDDVNADLRVRTIPASVTFSGGASAPIMLLGNGRTISIDVRNGIGTATFTYTITDPGGAESAPATVTVRGLPVPTTTTTTTTTAPPPPSSTTTTTTTAPPPSSSTTTTTTTTTTPTTTTTSTTIAPPG